MQRVVVIGKFRRADCGKFFSARLWLRQGGKFYAFRVSLRYCALRFAESISLVGRPWTEDRVINQGRFYQMRKQRISLRLPQTDDDPECVTSLMEAATARRDADIGNACLMLILPRSASPNR